MKFSLKINPSKLNSDELSIPLAILVVVGVAGLLAVSGARIDVLQILRRSKKKKWVYPSHINECFNSLIKNGLVAKDKNGRLSLTEKGELRLFRYQEEVGRLNKKWDGKWRIVIFDIWEKSRKKRDFLRNELAEFGFIKLQNSVWITPYECEEYVNLLKMDVGIGRGVVYIVADRVDNELSLKKRFGLM